MKVGDDARMRCKYCIDETSDIDDIDELANKCVQQLNAIEEAVIEQDLVPEQPGPSKVCFYFYIFTMLNSRESTLNDMCFFLILNSNT